MERIAVLTFQFEGFMSKSYKFSKALLFKKCKEVTKCIFYQRLTFLLKYFEDYLLQCARKGKIGPFLHNVTLSLETKSKEILNIDQKCIFKFYIFNRPGVAEAVL